MRLIEHYLSIQGEGLHPGKPTYFVRFARCNLRCVWCDSAYTFGKGKSVSFLETVTAIKKSKARYICLTGGEPLLHKKDCLQLILKFPALHFDIETGGSLDIASVQYPNTSVIMDWKLKGSKMGHKMKPHNLPLLRKDLDLLKLVTDGSSKEKSEISRLILRTEKFGTPISIQPVNGTDPRPLTEWMIAQKNPRLQINLQIHKIVWPTTMTGV